MAILTRGMANAHESLSRWLAPEISGCLGYQLERERTTAAAVKVEVVDKWQLKKISDPRQISLGCFVGLANS